MAGSFFKKRRRFYAEYVYAPFGQAGICFFLYGYAGRLYCFYKDGGLDVGFVRRIGLESAGNPYRYSLCRSCGIYDRRCFFCQKILVCRLFLGSRRNCYNFIFGEEGMVCAVSDRKRYSVCYDLTKCGRIFFLSAGGKKRLCRKGA